MTLANKLFFGDNLGVMRDHIASESVDLVYLDPPFNSKRDYNLIFRSPKGQQSDAQITAFEDSWQWGPQAEHEYAEVLRQSNTDAAEVLRSLRQFLRENDMMAYLTMMTNRILELHRVLKPSGSLYLHCDPTASHYLKIILDTIFGPQQFRNEIIWQRTRSHNDKSLTRYGAIHDVLLFYTKGPNWIFNKLHTKRDANAPKTHDLYTHTDGKIYRKDNCRAPGGRGPRFEWNGHIHNWRFTEEKARELEQAGLIVYSSSGMPRLLREVDTERGPQLQDMWTDISPPNSGSAEILGYPTQKPLALLERIIQVSTNPGDTVLDPFCGCGTAIHAAQKLGRRWLGIDITHLAISLIEKRLRDAFPGITFEAIGVPEDLDGARDLAFRDKYQFQWWACSLVNAQPYKGKKKGADGGTDGLIFFADDARGGDKKIIVSVKGGDNVGRTMVADLKNTVDREGAQIGLFVTLTPPTRPMITEAASAGFYSSPYHGDFPKIQILTIEGLLSGRERPSYPDMARGAQTFKRAKTEQVWTDQQSLDLD
jgi:DNA modification methylase